MKFRGLLAPLLSVLIALPVHAGEEITPVPQDLVASWKLDPFYKKHISVAGFPVLGSDKVSDYALKEAAWLVDRMIGHRPDILKTLAKQRIRFAVMAVDEMTTDLPEERTLAPKEFWDVRARGLGATPERPAVSCGEENLLCLKGDPYWKGNILVHEFSHAIQEQAMTRIDPTFDGRLQEAYGRARAAGRWKGTYAMQHYREFWAVGVQAWFDCVATNDAEHNHVGTREQLKAYEPDLAKLIEEVFGDRPWRYTKPSNRAGRDHLAGFDPTKAPSFSWPKHLKTIEQLGPMLPWMTPSELPSPPGPEGGASFVNFINRRSEPLVLEFADAAGLFQKNGEIPANSISGQVSPAGRVWRVSAHGKPLGGTVAGAATGRLEIR